MYGNLIHFFNILDIDNKCKVPGCSITTILSGQSGGRFPIRDSLFRCSIVLFYVSYSVPWCDYTLLMVMASLIPIKYVMIMPMFIDSVAQKLIFQLSFDLDYSFMIFLIR